MWLVVLLLKLFVMYLDASWRVRRPSNNLKSDCDSTSILLVIVHQIVTIDKHQGMALIISRYLIIDRNLPRQREPAMSATHSALPVVPDITARAESWWICWCDHDENVRPWPIFELEYTNRLRSTAWVVELSTHLDRMVGGGEEREKHFEVPDHLHFYSRIVPDNKI